MDEKEVLSTIGVEELRVKRGKVERNMELNKTHKLKDL